MKQPNIFDMSDSEYINDLRSRLMAVPAMYGVDGGDVDRLGVVADNMRNVAEPELTTNPDTPPDAPEPGGMLDLLTRCGHIVRKQYFRYTRNEKLADETAELVLQEVMRTYEQLAERAAPESLS